MNLFGTDGIRNHVGVYPFTQEGLIRLGRAIACWSLETTGTLQFMIATDTRYSASWVKAALTVGLTEQPSVITDLGVLPTPAAFSLVTQQKLPTIGIIISASHNPAEDNGIKLISSHGKLTLADEKRISALMNQPEATMYNGVTHQTSGDAAYMSFVVKRFPPRFLEGIRIVLDCANGATYRLAPEIFRACGAQTIVIHAQPDGHNINKNCGAVHPESLQEAVVQHKAMVGFAFDGDGDRVMAVTSSGVVKDGDDILALLSTHPAYKDDSTIVSTIMANQGFEAFLAAQGKKLIRTSVGDRHVLQAMSDQNALLGGEPSGHAIIRDLTTTGDGIIVALRIVETMLLTDNLNLTTFTKYPQILINVPIEIKRDLDTPPLSDRIAAAQNQLDTGRIVVRYSGTESIVRIMAEDVDSERMKRVASQLADELKVLLS